ARGAAARPRALSEPGRALSPSTEAAGLNGSPPPDQFQYFLHAFGIRAHAPDDELLGLEVGIRADRDVRKAHLQLAHQRVKACLDRECEAQLAHGGRRPSGEELSLELFGEDALHL